MVVVDDGGAGLMIIRQEATVEFHGYCRLCLMTYDISCISTHQKMADFINTLFESAEVAEQTYVQKCNRGIILYYLCCPLYIHFVQKVSK